MLALLIINNSFHFLMGKYSLDVTLVKESFDKDALRYIHFRSMQNFILHIDEIKNENDRSKIERYIDEYFNEIKNTDGLITDDFSKNLYKNLISQLGIYFQKHQGFRVVIRPSTFVPAIFIDLFLFFIGILKYIDYIPILTTFTLLFYLQGFFIYKRIHKSWGYRY